MKKVYYKLLDHTADFGIQVAGSNEKQLFINAALAMFDLLTDSDALAGSHTYSLHVQGTDRCDLMVNWLREMLYLWNGRNTLIKSVDIPSITEKELSASVTYDFFDPDIHEIKNEIKAVTYHQIKIKQMSNGWIANIIFDV